MSDKTKTKSQASSVQVPGQPEKRGGAGPRAVAEVTGRLTRKPLGKRGFAEGALVAGWPAIVGAMLGQHTLPLKIVFPPTERVGGVLHVRVASGALATQLQHLEPLIVQRINGHFGYGAVSRLHMVQGPLPPRRISKPPPPPDLTPAAAHALEGSLSKVADPELKTVLERLGRHVLAKKPQ
ncbi:MAG TPA: DciA family protein [Candidatus Sulfotelmatobacter sp.]|jgi:hypothetical protein|nr:DciA family protein [Candidatus Sulfotelmatobacter sp.]